MVLGATCDEIWGRIAGYQDDLAGRQLKVLEEIYKSETESHQRNRAIAQLMYAYRRIKDGPLQTCEMPSRQCSG